MPDGKKPLQLSDLVAKLNKSLRDGDPFLYANDDAEAPPVVDVVIDSDPTGQTATITLIAG